MEPEPRAMDEGVGRTNAFRPLFHRPFAERLEVGDMVSIAGIMNDGRRVNGKIIHIFEAGQLPGYDYGRHFVVEVSTSIDPILEVRSDFTVWPAIDEAEQQAEIEAERQERERISGDPIEQVLRTLYEAMRCMDSSTSALRKHLHDKRTAEEPDGKAEE